MRALHNLAALLGTTVAVLSATLSAQEFVRWQVWMDAEQRGAEWDAARHAQLLAAAHNGGQFQRKGGGPFTAADFQRHDPWAVQEPLTPEQLAERQAAEYAALLQQMEA